MPQRTTEYERREMRKLKKKHPIDVLTDLLVPKRDAD